MAKQKQKDFLVRQLREFFNEVDTNGDGVISIHEFNKMIENDDKLLEVLGGLELNQEDIYLLFEICSDDDGVADFDELMQAVMKLKTSAQTIDIIEILHGQMKISRALGS